MRCSYGSRFVRRSPLGESVIVERLQLMTVHRVHGVIRGNACVSKPDIRGRSRFSGVRNYGGRSDGVPVCNNVLRTDFAEKEIAKPRPGLNARILASMDSNRPTILDYEEIRTANTSYGLNVVFFDAMWRRSDLNLEQDAEVQCLISLACYHCLAGYRLSLILREAPDAFSIEHIRSQNTMRMLSEFRDFFCVRPGSTWNRDRALFVSTREDALRVPGSILAMLFAYREPLLRLHDEDQELLLAALHGRTDEELAQKLSLSLPAVKKRWAALFRRVAAVRADLAPNMDSDCHQNGRGKQKRHYLLDYLRAHPEELRPYCWRAAANHTYRCGIRNRLATLET